MSRCFCTLAKTAQRVSFCQAIRDSRSPLRRHPNKMKNHPLPVLLFSSLIFIPHPSSLPTTPSRSNLPGPAWRTHLSRPHLPCQPSAPKPGRHHPVRQHREQNPNPRQQRQASPEHYSKWDRRWREQLTVHRQPPTITGSPNMILPGSGELAFLNAENVFTAVQTIPIQVRQVARRRKASSCAMIPGPRLASLSRQRH